MTRSHLLATALLLLALPQSTLADPLVHTYSIVARDPATGEMGVAVQSHWFSVGSIVTWAEAGVGAVATQSFVDPGTGLADWLSSAEVSARQTRSTSSSRPTRNAPAGRSR